MADDYESTVGIGIKTNLNDSVTDMESLSAAAKDLLAITSSFGKKINIVNNLASAVQKIANTSMKAFNDNLQKANSYLGNMGGEMQKLNAENFSNVVGKMESGVRAYNNLMRSMYNTNKKYANSNAPISLPTIDISGLQQMVTELSSFDVTKFSKFSYGLRNFVNSTNYLKELDIDDSTIKKLQAKMEQISSVYTSFINKMNSMNLTAFSDGMKAVAKVPTAMKKMESLDTSKIGAAFDTISEKIRSFIVTLNEGEGSLQSFATITTNFANFNRGVESTDRVVKKLGKSSETTRKKLSHMLSFGKIYALYNQLRHFSKGFIDMLNKSIDFTEIENYFSRAMGNMRGEAMKFQTKLSGMFGLSMPDMMKAQAMYKNMLSSFGNLTDKFTYDLSERITKMSLDFSSLFNVPFDSTFNKFQAVLSRQVRPIRNASGFDTTQSVLQITLREIGINDRKIAQMNELEKRLLTILTLQKQMDKSKAMGDFSRTIKFSGFVSRDTSNNLVNASKSGVVVMNYC